MDRPPLGNERFPRLLLPVATAIVIAFALVVGVLLAGAAENDETAVEAQQHHLRTALAEATRVVRAGNRDYGWWDELHRQIEPIPNIPLLETYFGVDVPTAFGVTHTLVLKPDGGLIYGIAKGRQPLAEGFQEGVVSRIGALMEKAQNASYAEAKAEAGLIVLDHTPHIVSVMRFTPEKPPPLAEQAIARPFLVFIRKLDTVAVTAIGEAYLLKGLAFSDDEPHDGRASLVLANDEGGKLGYFVWEPARPGRTLLLQVGPIVVATFAVVGFLMVVFWRRAHGLIQEYNATILELHAEKRRTKDASRAKSDFLACMSHELRTPLNAIIGYSQLLSLRDGIGKHVDIDDAAGVIQRSGRHLLQLVEEILDLARAEEGRLSANMEIIDLAEALRDATAIAQAIADKHRIKLAVEIPPPGTVTVGADGVKLNQVLVNLMVNAIKYNRKDGRVDVRIARPDADKVRIDVIDTGIGISPEDRPRLFRPFVRLNSSMSSAGGAGIGLALSRDLVELMGGRIGFESELGKGSRFWVELESGGDRPAA